MFVATLSFLLPGLGQLFQRRLALASALFLAFTLLSFFPKTLPYSTLVAFLAAWEAARAPRMEPPATSQERWRKAIYLIVGCLANLAWGLAALSSLLDLRGVA